MRLLQVVPAYTSYDVFLRELAETAVAAGHPTAAVCGAVPADVGEWDRGVRIFRLRLPRGASPTAHWIAGRALRAMMQHWRPDVVHAHFSAGIFTTALALRRDDRWISFGTFQGLSFPLSRQPMGTIVRAAETFAARRFDHVHVLTADDLDALRRAAPSAHVALQRGYGFGCADRFLDTRRPSAAERRSLRRAAGLPDTAPVLVFVGRLVAFKGFDLAVRAFWRIKQLVPEVRLLVVGEADALHRTGLSAAEWRQYEEDRDIVRVGRRRDVLPFLDLADLMLLPTTREGMPVCVMEALARGLPVAVPPVRGCRELVVDGRNGFVIAPRSESAWADRLAALLQERSRMMPDGDPELREALRRSRWVNDCLSSYVTACSAKHGQLRSSRATQQNPSSVNSCSAI